MHETPPRLPISCVVPREFHSSAIVSTRALLVCAFAILMIIMMRIATLVVALSAALFPGCCYAAKYQNKPRVRREIRTLTERQRKVFAE